MKKESLFTIITCYLAVAAVAQSHQQDNHGGSNHDHHKMAAAGRQTGGNTDIGKLIAEKCKNDDAVCVGGPENCYNKDSQNGFDCEFLVVIKKESNNPNYRFSLVGPAEGAHQNRFVSVAISEHKDSKYSGVVECNTLSDESLRVWWSNGTGTGQQKSAQPEGVSTIPYPEGYMGNYNDRIVCEFTRVPMFNVYGKQFDLNQYNYYVLLAGGKLDDAGKPSTYETYFLTKDKISLRQKVKNNASSSFGSSTLIIISGMYVVSMKIFS